LAACRAFLTRIALKVRFLVAKIDLAEVYAPMRARLWLTILFVGVLLFGVAAAGGFFWRQQQVRRYRERFEVEEALRETNQYLESLFNCANAPIIVWDTQFRIIRFNHAFESLTGRRGNLPLHHSGG
jgi:PAS domain-containing protein